MLFVELGLVFLVNEVSEETYLTALSNGVEFEFSHGSSLLGNEVLVND